MRLSVGLETDLEVLPLTEIIHSLDVESDFEKGHSPGVPFDLQFLNQFPVGKGTMIRRLEKILPTVAEEGFKGLPGFTPGSEGKKIHAMAHQVVRILSIILSGGWNTDNYIILAGKTMHQQLVDGSERAIESTSHPGARFLDRLVGPALNPVSVGIPLEGTLGHVGAINR